MHFKQNDKNQNTLKLGVHSTPNRAMQNKKAG
jgi:hypothetical protein